MGGFEFFGERLGGGSVVGVVDGDVAALCCEGAGDFGAEASVFTGCMVRERFLSLDLVAIVCCSDCFRKCVKLG